MRSVVTEVDVRPWSSLRSRLNTRVVSDSDVSAIKDMNVVADGADAVTAGIGLEVTVPSAATSTSAWSRVPCSFRDDRTTHRHLGGATSRPPRVPLASIHRSVS